ncbi:MAG: DUF4113 domain-containing protein [Dehalococcoidia bacterium]|nr:MAG: Y-family DNA polymerase [Chloroflexota bacterium]|tara:strand:+ start:4271 stop:5521 length:1251 start_codon:yes stop_codon:yes gene_type:complete
MIFLVDCNNFYVSCERLFRPELSNLPVVVLSNNDGCIISRSNEAKKLGIKMGEPLFKAKKIIEENKINVFSSNFELYGEISNRIMKELNHFSSSMEIYSIDEAFLDIDFQDYNLICENIVNQINNIIGIPISVGVGYTKTLSKIAGSIAKKLSRGYFVLDNTVITKNILSKTSVQDIWGLGSRYSNTMINNGIKTADNLVETNRNWILNKFNINVLRTREELRGISCYPISSVSEPRKSIRVSRSFKKDINSYENLEKYISDFAFLASKKLRNENKRTKELSVFIITNRFRNTSFSNYMGFQKYSFIVSTNSYIEIIRYSILMLRKIFKGGLSYKKAGVMLSNLSLENQYQTSYLSSNQDNKLDNLMEKIDYLNDKYGKNKVLISSQNLYHKSKIDKKRLSPNYLNSWSDMPNINI